MFAKMILGWGVAIGLITLMFMVIMPTDDLTPRTVYDVDPLSNQITLSKGEQGRNDINIWKQVTDIIPAEFLSRHIRHFALFSDGFSDTLAYVSKSSHQPDSWTLAFDRRDYRMMNSAIFKLSIIHEYAHILSLEPDQLAFQWGCKSFRNNDGCFKEEAYLNQWYQQFWAGNLEKAHKAQVARQKRSDQKLAISAFYQHYSDHFVSEYAATNISEDFAESFVSYVIQHIPEKPSTVLENKIAFFDQFKELQAFRDQARGLMLDQ